MNVLLSKQIGAQAHVVTRPFRRTAEFVGLVRVRLRQAVFDWSDRVAGLFVSTPRNLSNVKPSCDFRKSLAYLPRPCSMRKQEQMERICIELWTSIALSWWAPQHLWVVLTEQQSRIT